MFGAILKVGGGWGSNCLFPIETHITCDFPGGGPDPLSPPLDPHLKDHNTVTPVRLEPAALRSRVKHSTTEPLRSRHALELRHVYHLKGLFTPFFKCVYI